MIGRILLWLVGIVAAVMVVAHVIMGISMLSGNSSSMIPEDPVVMGIHELVMAGVSFFAVIYAWQNLTGRFVENY